VERAMNFGAAGIAAGMDNPVAVVATFEGSRQ
jgi:2-succinyl-5-enolpyruvyl-6-hydroxy-3-cyclohexene-1-carboxylate synthase